MIGFLSVFSVEMVTSNLLEFHFPYMEMAEKPFDSEKEDDKKEEADWFVNHSRQNSLSHISSNSSITDKQIDGYVNSAFTEINTPPPEQQF